MIHHDVIDYQPKAQRKKDPALHRLERQKWIRAEWTMSERNQRTRVYELTAAGRAQLVKERSRWQQLSAAIGSILSHPAGGTS